MSTISVDIERLREIATDLEKLVGRLDLGQANYLRNTLGAAASGDGDLSRALDEFENEWDFGRDRIMGAITTVARFLAFVAENYAATEHELSQHLAR